MSVAWIFLWASAASGAGESWPPEVRVDPRFELLAAVHLASNGGGTLDGFAALDIPYARDMRDYFKSVREHPAVDGYLQLRRGGYDAVSVQKLMLDISDPPQLRVSGERSGLEREWLKSLRDFARVSRFNKFFSSHQSDYRRWVASVQSEMKERDYRSLLEEYTGLKTAAAYTVILAPLRDKSRGNMNHIACPPDGGPRRIFSSIGPTEIRGGEPVFEFWTRRWDVWHELGHTLFDSHLAAHPRIVRRTRSLYKPVAAPCYGSWDQCLREHLVQGLAFRMLSWAAERSRTSEPVWGYRDKKNMSYLEPVIERLREFESGRGKYKTLADFYPRWIEVFLELVSSADTVGDDAEARSPVEPANSDCLREGMGIHREPLGPPRVAQGETLGAVELKQRGVWCYLQGDVDAALLDFNAARVISDKDAELELNLSVALLQKGRLDEALESADRAVAWAVHEDGKPSALGADSLSTRAAVLRRLGFVARALKDEERALAITPPPTAPDAAPETGPRRP